MMKTDRRSRKTQAALTSAFISLLREKPLKEITITELTQRADVNRATFYTHFQDVYDMYRFVREEICNMCDEKIEAHAPEIANSEFSGILSELFQYLSDNKDVFDIFQNNQLGPSFFNEITDRIHAKFLLLIDPISMAEAHDDKTKMVIKKNRKACMQLCSYEFNYVVGGIVNVMKSWLEHGCVEPVDFIVECTINFIGDDQQAILRQNISLIGKK